MGIHQFKWVLSDIAPRIRRIRHLLRGFEFGAQAGVFGFQILDSLQLNCLNECHSFTFSFRSQIPRGACFRTFFGTLASMRRRAARRRAWMALKSSWFGFCVLWVTPATP